MPVSHYTKPLILVSIVAAIGICIFVWWVVTVLLPVSVIEIHYQYHKILADVFQVSDIRGLILPQFHIDMKGFSSRYKTNGITIPTLFIDSPVQFNVDPNDEKAWRSALAKGIAHASGSSFPGTGGLGYYFAHSSTPTFVAQYNAVFYLLDKLEKGDEIYIWHNGTRFDYAVYQKEITVPTDVSFLKKSYDRDTIVLQTCWPPGTTLKRLLVFAHEIPKP